MMEIETGNRMIGNEYDTFPKELFPDYPFLMDEDEVNFLYTYIYILEQRAYECLVITLRKKMISFIMIILILLSRSGVSFSF